MGKKTTNTKTEAPAKRAPKSKPAAETAPTKPVAEKAPPAKPVTAKPKASPRAAKTTAVRKKKPAFSQDDIALRAYYIAERRLSAGIHADPHQDWIEAERQLAYEAGTTVAPKAKKAKS